MPQPILDPSMALIVSLVGPLAVGAVIVLLGKRPNLRDGAGVVGAAGVFATVALGLLPAVRAGGRPEWTVLELLGDLAIAFRVEPLGVLFAMVASGLWIVTSIYAVGYLRGHHETHQTRFFLCFALAIFGALGVAYSANLLTLFLFYELITLSTYPLVTHRGDVAAKRAGRVYLGLLMSTSIAFLLLAIAWTYSLTGTLDFRDGGILSSVDPSLLTPLLALFAFGTAKAALMPFHRWLPAAMVAPTPVSAMLHAVAVVKAGVFTVTKIVVYVFGLDLLRETGASAWLVWVAAFTLLSSSIVALSKDELKARLAYSTISQLAYIVLGAALVAPKALLGAGLHIVMHAFGKITLFFCAGAIDVAAHRKKISRMHGIGRRMPLTMFAFFVGSLSVAGIPPFGGAWSKWLLAEGAADGQRVWVVALYMASSLLALAYLMPVVLKTVFLPPREDDAFATAAGRSEPLLCVLPPLVTAAGCLVLFFTADPIVELLEGMLR